MDRPSDATTGVKAFSIAGRTVDVRQRCKGMTDEERRWRAQFLKDQYLSPREPMDVPELYKETTNFFRRLWKTPMYKFQNFLIPIMGQPGAMITRRIISKIIIFYMFGLGGAYYFMYHENDWQRAFGISTYVTRPKMYPDHPNYPYYHENTAQDYFCKEFYSTPFAKVDSSKKPSEN